MEQVPNTPGVPAIERVRHELKRRTLTVAAIEPVGPAFLAITFTGEALADFTSLSFDDHVKLFFDDADAPGEEVWRDYTPRRFDRAARTLVIEFALHGDGKAACWARTAQVGNRMDVGGPRGSMVVPAALDWHLLVGDATALPAISRRLEELPPGSRADVFVLADADERRGFVTQAAADVRWCDTADGLLAALAALPQPRGVGFAWGGGEASMMARVRQVLADKGIARQATRVSAYWKRGVSAHHENLE